VIEMADKNDTTAWTKEQVERGIYRRENAEGAVKFFVQVRTKRGNATGTFDKIGEARKWRAKVIEEMRQNRYFGDVPGAKISVADAITDYMKAKGITTQSDVTRYGRLMYWSNEFKALPVLELDAGRVAETLDDLAEDVSGATVNRYATVLSAAWKWWSKAPRRWVRAEANPVREVERKEDSKLREVTLSKEERAKLLDECAKVNSEMHAAAVLALLTGMRHGEMKSLLWKDVKIHGDKAETLLANTKNGDSRKVVFKGRALEALKSLPRGIGNAHVFSDNIRNRNTLRSLWKQARDAAGLPTLRWHDLRHVAAQLQLEGGSSLVEVMMHLGHRSAQTSRRYMALETAHREKLADRAGEIL
jgi:integrase